MSTKKVSLFEISEEQHEIINAIQEFDGEITPQLEEALMINEKNRNQKVMAYVNVFATSDGLIATATELKKRCDAVIKRENAKQERMKSNLLGYIKQFGEFSIGIMKFGTRKSTTLEVEVDVNELPEEYRTKKVTITADKKALKEAIERGEKIEGVRLQENQNLRIN